MFVEIFMLKWSVRPRVSGSLDNASRAQNGNVLSFVVWIKV